MKAEKEYGLTLMGPADELKAVERQLTIHNPKVEHAAKMGIEVPEYLRFYEKVSGGLLVPREFEVPVESVIDKMIPGNELKPSQFIGEVRQEQKSAMTAMEKNNWGSGIVVMPCGKGKTVLAGLIINQLKKKTLVITHQRFMVIQTAEMIGKFFPDWKITLFMGGRKGGDYHGDVVISTVQYLLTFIKAHARKESFFDEFGIVITDESHRHSASSWAQAIQLFRCRHRFGLTATPKRSDGLENVFKMNIGKIIHEEQEVVKTGAQRVEVVWLKSDWSVPIFKVCHWVTKEIMIPRLQTVVSKYEKRNKMILKTLNMILTKNPKRKILVVGHRKKQLAELKEKFRKRGIKTDDFIEDRVVDKEVSEAQVLFAIFNKAVEALDLPAMDTLFIVTPFSAEQKLKQLVGRIQREFPGKQKPMVVDIEDKFFICKSMAGKRMKFYRLWGYKQINQ